VIVAGGSDTTFRAMVGLADLWQESGLSGCPHRTGVGPTQNSCQTDITTNLANYQGDTIANANPVGSGGGIGSLNGNGGAGGTHEGSVNPINNTSRTDTDGVGGATVTVTGGSPTVTDSVATSADEGKSVSGPGIPVNTYVGPGTVTGGQFGLSSAPDQNRPINATAGGTSVTIQPYACVNGTTGPNVDVARSSRAERTSGANTAAPCANELIADTFWGYAQDGVEVIGFNHHGDLLNSNPNLTANQIANIWNCTGGTGTGGRVRWSDILPSVTAGGPDDGDIVPWRMNTSSGTHDTFRDWVRANTVPPQGGFTPNAAGCTRQLATAGVPLENDIKPLINDPSAGTFGTGDDNPENWMWWGSFGVFNTFPYTSNYTRAGTPYVATAASITGKLPGLQSILNLTYPISRTLFHVTRKADADCVKAAGSTTSCDFNGVPGPGGDLNVTGGTKGTPGAIREFTRFLCRVSNTQQGTDPFTGANFGGEITTAISNAGFTVIKSAAPSPRTPGTRCKIDT
jgi:hypothetical protein